MANSKIIFNNDILVDITSDTVSESNDLYKDVIALNSNGISVVGDIHYPLYEDEIIQGTIFGQYVNNNITNLKSYAFLNCTNLKTATFSSLMNVGVGSFSGCTNLVSFSAPNLTGTIQDNAFKNCVNLTNLIAPKVTSLVGIGYTGLIHIFTPDANTYGIKNNPNLLTIVLKSMHPNYSNTFINNPVLTSVDFTNLSIFPASCFNGDTNFNLLILRKNTIASLTDSDVFTNTCFDENGTGGTIYIPKSLYDHLGDNSASDYKAASNWSTYNAYGTITWAQIQGSYYETHYVDGTLIPTT